MRAWQIVSADGVDALELATRQRPEPGPGQVLVRIHASSINYRDLATIEDPLPRGIVFPRVPNSDGAGEILALGAGTGRFAVGDRVMGCFFQAWPAGGITAAAMASALGGARDGVLAEEVVLDEAGLVAIPPHLTFEEAATLPCAALTAWHALVEKGRIKAGETVLLLGTGGVSIFALQLATMQGARAIIVSKSDEKLERARALGAWKTINYRAVPEWGKAVVEATGGRGVDHVVEVGGAGTLERSIEAARIGGHVALIGVLTGGQINPTPIMRKSMTMYGIYVGSREMMESMCRAIDTHALRPVIHETFAFEDARRAFHAMRAADHMGKLVIRVAG